MVVSGAAIVLNHIMLWLIMMKSSSHPEIIGFSQFLLTIIHESLKQTQIAFWHVKSVNVYRNLIIHFGIIS